MHGLFVRVLPALLLLVAAPAHLHAQDPQLQLEQQDEVCLDTTFDEAAPATLPIATQFDSLLQKVSAAKGGAKMEAIAKLFAALVQDRRSMHDAMITHMAMMLAIMQRLDDCEAGHFCRPQ